MSTPASKRRRLGSGSSSRSTSSALHKPFRTPLRKPTIVAVIDGTPESSDGDKAGYITNPDAKNEIENSPSGCVKHNGCTSARLPSDRPSPSHNELVINKLPETRVSEKTSATANSASTDTAVHGRDLRRHNHAVLTPSCSNNTRKPGPVVPDPDIAAAQKEQRALERRQRSFRADIDVLEQALRVARRRQQQQQRQEEQAELHNENNKRSTGQTHTSEKETSVNGDTRLENLMLRWRDASRRAAEEVFAGARERVNRMGGVAAWKERERERLEQQHQNSSWGWDSTGAGGGATATRGSDHANDENENDDDDDDDRGRDEKEKEEEESEYDKMIKEEEEEERALQGAASGFDAGNVSELASFLISFLQKRGKKKRLIVVDFYNGLDAQIAKH